MKSQSVWGFMIVNRRDERNRDKICAGAVQCERHHRR